MATVTASRQFLTTGQAARRLGVPEWTVSRLFARGLAEEPPRLGRSRVIDEADLPQLRDALQAAGYLPAAQDSGEPPPAKPGPEGKALPDGQGAPAGRPGPE